MRAVVHKEMHHPVDGRLLPVGFEFDGADPNKGSDEYLAPLLADPIYEPNIAVTSRVPAGAVQRSVAAPTSTVAGATLSAPAPATAEKE
jgi:hypothetical protein